MTRNEVSSDLPHSVISVKMSKWEMILNSLEYTALASNTFIHVTDHNKWLSILPLLYLISTCWLLKKESVKLNAKKNEYKAKQEKKKFKYI